jgi:uncharacterized membrane protein
VRWFQNFFLKAIISGCLLALPIYLTFLLLAKAMKSVGGLVRPLTRLAPSGLQSKAAEDVIALLIVLLVLFVLGAVVLTRPGQFLRRRVEDAVFVKIPGYTLVRSFTEQLAGHAENVWKPAIAQMDDGLVPAFIIEELQDGRYTVFIPGSPAPFAGTVYILEHQRVHPVKISFAQTLQTLSRWGSGAKNMVAAME